MCSTSNASEDILALRSHQTLFKVSSETTICLSLGDLPVNFPVSTRRVPPIPSSPSLRDIDWAIKSGSVRL